MHLPELLCVIKKHSPTLLPPPPPLPRPEAMSTPPIPPPASPTIRHSRRTDAPAARILDNWEDDDDDMDYLPAVEGTDESEGGEDMFEGMRALRGVGVVADY